jgi:hypothetical protein
MPAAPAPMITKSAEKSPAPALSVLMNMAPLTYVNGIIDFRSDDIGNHANNH